MILMEAIALSGGAIFVGMQLFDRARGIKKPLRLMAKKPTLADRLTTGIKEGAVLVDGEMVQTVARNGAIVATTVAASLIHIQTGGSLLVLNGTGYMVLLVAYYLPPLANYQHITRDVLISYTAVSFGGYFAINGITGLVNRPDLLAKLVEAGLLTVLWMEREEENNDVLIIDQKPQMA